MMEPHEDTLNLGATLPRHPTASSAASDGPSAELELLHTIKIPGTGTLVFNRYRLQRVLGRGGMGVVWLADDTKLDRQVALKFLPDVIGADPVALKELKDETRRGLDLAHPNIVRIYDFVDDEEAAAISMEYVNGKSLSEMRLGLPQHVFSVDALGPWLSQMCEALDYAHLQRRIVHRDLKPANLMVNTESQIKITDFGIARSVSDTMSRLSMLRANTSGTLLYMSPQQAMGDRPKPTDDVYSVGATLYEMLSGKPPFYSGDISMQITAKNAPSVRQRREELEIDAADDIPKDWEDAIAACLNKDPAKRPQTAGELARRLGISSRTDPITTGVKVRSDGPKSIHVRTDRGIPSREAAQERRSTWIPIGATLALVLGVGAAAGGWWWLNRPAQLWLQSDPPGAVVSMSGQTQMTPAVFGQLKPGHYSARVSVEGYEPQNVEMDLSAGQRFTPPTVTLAPSQGSLLLSSDPDGVPFEVRPADDDKAIPKTGETPKTLRLPIGLYEVKMRHEGELQTIDVDVSRNSERQQTFRFIKATPPAPSTQPALANNVPTQQPAQAPPARTPGPNADTPPAATPRTVAMADIPPSVLHPSSSPAEGRSTPSGSVGSAGSSTPLASGPSNPGSSSIASLNRSLGQAPADGGPAVGTPGANINLVSTNPSAANPSAAVGPTGTLAPQAPGASGLATNGAGMPHVGSTAPTHGSATPATPGPLASAPPAPGASAPGLQPVVEPPSAGYWKLEEIFNNSSFNSYSRNGKAYLLFEAQAALKEKSHYRSPVDGKVGQGTHKAIVSFQSANGLQPTGQLDAPTINALGIGSIEDKSDWSAPARKRSSRSGSGGGGGDPGDDDPSWWRTNVADPFKRAFRRP